MRRGWGQGYGEIKRRSLRLPWASPTPIEDVVDQSLCLGSSWMETNP